MRTPKYLIYGLVDARTGEVRYVGKSSSGLYRPRSHGQSWSLKNYGYLPVVRWILKQRAEGVEYGIKILEVVLDPKDLGAREVDWIAKIRESGADLLNLTLGGEGAPGCIQSEATRMKRGQALRGRIFSEEHRRRISEARGGRRPKDLSKVARGGFRPGTPRARAVMDDLGNSFSSVGQAAKHYKVDRATIRRAAQGQTFSSSGRSFRYLE